MKYTILFIVLTAILLAGPANPEIHLFDQLLISRELLIDFTAYVFVAIMVIALSIKYFNYGVVIGACAAVTIIGMFVITGLNRGWLGAIVWFTLLFLSLRADIQVRKFAKASAGETV